MNCAFSAWNLRCIYSWDVAPGSNERAPLALNMRHADSSIYPVRDTIRFFKLIRRYEKC